MDKVYCNLGPSGEGDLSLDWLIECLISLPENELQYVLEQVNKERPK